MRAPRCLAVAGTAALLLAAAGCGGSDDDASEAVGSTTATTTAAKASAFPRASGLTLARVRSRYGRSLAIAPGVGVVRDGTTRVPFLILDAQAEPVDGAAVAVYTMRKDGTGVRGPYTTREQPFAISSAYLSKSTSSDPDQQKAFYVADVPTDGAPTAAFAIVRQGDQTLATSPTTIGMVARGAQPPDVGDKAIAMHTLTTRDVAGDYAKVTTRQPPDKEMVAEDFADVLGKKPVVLVFATPALCQSRVCGPTVDVAEQVRGEFGDRVAWVHQEIFVDNDVAKGLRPQVRRWHLKTEPWVFVIGRDGGVAARAEGAISVPELHAMVAKVAG